MANDSDIYLISNIRYYPALEFYFTAIFFKMSQADPCRVESLRDGLFLMIFKCFIEITLFDKWIQQHIYGAGK